MIRHFEEIETIIRDKPPGRIVVAAAHDGAVLQSVHEVSQKGYANPILIGDKRKYSRSPMIWASTSRP